MSSSIDVKDLLAEQRTGVGGSESAAIRNIGYGCARAVFYKKSQTRRDYEDDENRPTFYGSTLESSILSEYVRRSGRVVTTPQTLFRSSQHPHIIAHLDGLQGEDFDTPPGDGCLEIKCLGDHTWAKYKAQGIHPSYYIQIQHQMLAAGIGWGTFAVMHRRGNELDSRGRLVVDPTDFEIDYWDVNADPDEQRRIVEATTSFWHDFEAGVMPDRLERGDKRCMKCPWRDTCWVPQDIEEIKKALSKHRRQATYHANRVAEYEQTLIQIEQTQRRLDEDHKPQGNEEAGQVEDGRRRRARSRKNDDGPQGS